MLSITHPLLILGFSEMTETWISIVNTWISIINCLSECRLRYQSGKNTEKRDTLTNYIHGQKNTLFGHKVHQASEKPTHEFFALSPHKPRLHQAMSKSK